MKITITAEGFYGKVSGEFVFDIERNDSRTLADSCIADILNAAGIEDDEESTGEESEVGSE